jgi:asparagine synthetase A
VWYLCDRSCAYWSSQIYAVVSSLTTHRRQLANKHLPQYLELIADRKLENKLPEALRKQREEERAKNLGHTAFSTSVFGD